MKISLKKKVGWRGNEEKIPDMTCGGHMRLYRPKHTCIHHTHNSKKNGTQKNQNIF